MLQAYSAREQGADGKPVDKFKIEVNETGQMRSTASRCDLADVTAITSCTLIEPHRSPSVRLFFCARSRSDLLQR